MRVLEVMPECCLFIWSFSYKYIIPLKNCTVKTFWSHIMMMFFIQTCVIMRCVIKGLHCTCTSYYQWHVMVTCIMSYQFCLPLSIYHSGKCKLTRGYYNGLIQYWSWPKIYTYRLYDACILFYLWWHWAHRPSVTLQFMALPRNCWFNSWIGRQN